MTGDAIAREAKVSVYDRSYLYGDSLYEVVRSYGGKFLHLDEHLKRLASSAKLARLDIAQSQAELTREIDRTFQAFRKLPGYASTEAYCRLILSRGEGSIGFSLKCLTTKSLFTIIVQPLELPTAEQRAKGLSMRVAERLRNDPRALDPAMKSGNYLNSLLAYLEETSKGDCDDALLLNHDGHVTEGTTFNVFYVKRGIVATPPLDIGILDGVTRRHTLALARELGYETRETRFPRERLAQADEIFLSSTIKEVFPITRLDGKPVGNGKPGPITLKLAEAFAREARG